MKLKFLSFIVCLVFDFFSFDRNFLICVIDDVIFGFENYFFLIIFLVSDGQGFFVLKICYI